MPESFFTKIVGVTQPGRQYLINNKLSENDSLLLIREPNNPADRNAVMVLTEGKEQLGYLSRERAAEVAPKMDSGWFCNAFVDTITGLEEDTQGVNIEVYLTSPSEISIPKSTRNITSSKTLPWYYGLVLIFVSFIVVGFGQGKLPESIINFFSLAFLVSIGFIIWTLRKNKKKRR